MRPNADSRPPPTERLFNLHRTAGGSNQSPDMQGVLNTKASLQLRFTGSKRANSAGLGDDTYDQPVEQALKRQRANTGSYLDPNRTW